MIFDLLFGLDENLSSAWSHPDNQQVIAGCSNEDSYSSPGFRGHFPKRAAGERANSV